MKPLLENSESLVKSAKEAYTHQLKVLKEELHCKNKIINGLLETIGKLGNGKHNIQTVHLIIFEYNLTTSSYTVTDSENDPKSDKQQQSHDNKQQISSKELSENSKEKGSTNSILVTDSVNVPRNKIRNNKAMVISKKIAKKQ